MLLLCKESSIRLEEERRWYTYVIVYSPDLDEGFILGDRTNYYKSKFTDKYLERMTPVTTLVIRDKSYKKALSDEITNIKNGDYSSVIDIETGILIPLNNYYYSNLSYATNLNNNSNTDPKDYELVVSETVTIKCHNPHQLQHWKVNKK